MNKTLSKQLNRNILFLLELAGILIFLNITSYPGPNKILSFKYPSKAELDSVNSVMNRCDSDTCRFNLLQGMFWKHRFAGSGAAEFYGRWAYETIKNSSSPKELSNGYSIKAILLLDKNKIDSAHYFINKALTVSKKINYAFRIAWSYQGLGKIAYIHGDIRSAINNFLLSKQWFLKVKNIPAPDDELNHLLAESYVKLNNYDSALVYYLENIKLAKKTSNKKFEIESSLDLSSCYKYLNNIKKSTEYLYNALKIAEETNNDEILSTIYMKIGDIFLEEKKNYPSARTYYLKGLELSQKFNLTKLVSSVCSQIGRTYLEENNISRAMEYFQKSLEISQRINYRHALSDSYLHLGYAYKRLNNDKLAMESFTKCWQTQCDFCPPITFHEALVGIADIYLKENNFQQAYNWYEKSLELADSNKEIAKISISKLALGNYFQRMKQNARAEQSYLQSLQLAREVKSISLIKNIADTLSSFYQLQRNFQSAINYLKLARAMDDSLAKAEQQSSMANLEMNFEFERLTKDNEEKMLQSREEIKRQRVLLYSLILISVLLTVLGAVVLRSYKRKKEDNLLLTLQKEEIAKKNLEIQSQVDEITLQKNEIEKISNQLHELDQMKLNFFTNISHELRTPLTLIVSPLIKLIKNTENEELKDLYSLMFRNARKLQNLIDRLLDISKLDKGELKLNLRKNNLNKLIRVIASMFQSISEEKNIEFNLIEKNKDIIFSFDAERIDQVIINLLSNAFKFTPNDGKIVLQVSANCFQNEENNLSSSSNYVEIKIWDNGPGIPPESIDKIFDRFYQSDSTISRNFEGSGIGLALVKEFVELHNGKISVKSEPGKWTEFTITLPLVFDESSEVSEGYTPKRYIDEVIDYELANKDLISPKQPDTILLVEDNADLRSYLKECLSKQFNVIIACNGTEGIESAKLNIPDIIISDVMMPETDGYQLTFKLKGNINTSHIPIILLTAKAGRDSKLEGLEKGADDYIIKPFDEEELILKIRNILLTRQKLQQKYREQIITTPSEIECKSLDDQFLFNLTDIVEQEISNPELDVDLLCNKVNLSRPQLYRKLKALTGLSINHFIRSIRLKRAAQLLQKKAATVSEIAYMTGFENLSYFTKKFKEEFGRLPSEF